MDNWEHDYSLFHGFCTIQHHKYFVKPYYFIKLLVKMPTAKLKSKIIIYGRMSGQNEEQVEKAMMKQSSLKLR